MNKKKLKDSEQINDALYITSIKETPLKEKLSISEKCIQSLLDKVFLTKLGKNQTLKCEGVMTVRAGDITFLKKPVISN